MGHRLSKIYTRTGDDGTTGLGAGARVAKDHARIEAIGTVDELNSLVGLVLAYDPPEPVRAMLTRVQHELFELGGELSLPGAAMIMSPLIAQLEQNLDSLNAELAPLKEFVLPGGTVAAAACHAARTVCRRAERTLVRLNRTEPVNTAALHYLNRLSDLLFVAARYLNKVADRPEPMWQQQRLPTP